MSPAYRQVSLILGASSLRHHGMSLHYVPQEDFLSRAVSYDCDLPTNTRSARDGRSFNFVSSFQSLTLLLAM